MQTPPRARSRSRSLSCPSVRSDALSLQLFSPVTVRSSPGGRSVANSAEPEQQSQEVTVIATERPSDCAGPEQSPVFGSAETQHKFQSL